MSDSLMDYDPLNEGGEIPLKPGEQPPKLELAQAIERKQLPFFQLIAKFHDLFWALPSMTARDVDPKLQEMYDLLMEASSTVGISRNSVPRLRECCGKTRVWPGEKKPFLLGNLLKKIFGFFGFKPCPGCERRRKFFNKLTGGREE